MAKDFLGKPAPPGYVAGLGRGATGFMTRPDLGSGRDVALTTPNVRFSSDRSTVIIREEDEDRMAKLENEEGLLAPSGAYDAEDEEADRIFAAIEAKMAQRREKQKAQAELIKKRRDEPETVGAVFADLKKDLTKVTMEEWAALPEAGDFRAKRMKKSNDKDRYTPLPDSLIVGDSMTTAYGNYAEDEELDTSDFAKIQAAREKVLGLKIDKAIYHLGGAEKSFDSAAYLAGLDAQRASKMDIGDSKRARLVLQSALTTNPHSASAWIAAVRLEESDMDLKKAREMIKKACAACPESEDVWLEALRLLPREQSMEIMNSALDSIPSSSRLWLKAADLEQDVQGKRTQLRRAIEKSPGAADLWRHLVELEETEADAKLTLTAAVEQCPNDLDLWLALARLEDHVGARKTINKARQLNPKNLKIWLAAARLEEAYENYPLVEMIIQRAKEDLDLPRENWISAAVECESTKDVQSAVSIIKNIGHDAACLEEAKICKEKGAVNTAKQLLRFALKAENSPSIWLELVELCIDDKSAVLMEAIKACPKSEDIWIALITHESTEENLNAAYSELSTSEAIWIKAIELAKASNDLTRARTLLDLAISKGIQSEAMWLTAVELSPSEAQSKSILVQGLQSCPTSGKMWITLAGLELANPQVARGVLEKGMANCPTDEDVWIEAANFELGTNDSTSFARARVILEKGRGKCLKSENLWLESIKLEIKAGQTAMAKSLLAKALQACPKSGLLWYQAIDMEPRLLKKGKANAALSALGGKDPFVFLAQAKFAWADRNFEQARSLLEQSLVLDPQNGDVWGFYLLFAQNHLSSELDAITKVLVDANPRGGLLWRSYHKTHETSDFVQAFRNFILTLQTPT